MSPNEIFKNYPGEEKPPRRGIWLGLIALVFAGAFLYSIRLALLAHDALRTKTAIEADLVLGAQAAERLDFEGATEAIKTTNERLSALHESFSNEPIFQFSLAEFPKLIGDIADFSKTAFDVGGRFLDIAGNGFAWMTGGKGEILIERLKTLERGIAELGTAGAEVKERGVTLGYDAPETISETEGALFQTEQILKAFINWLEAPNDRHVALFFQNISEMRPTGGFIGSYSVLTINRGSLTDFKVDDIYNPDGQLPVKIRPPEPLQGITGSWGARDANWFPDAPTSFAKVLWFLEQSRTYADQNIKFDAAVAVNPNVVADLLQITGPIYLPDYDLEINSGNALDAIQREVRSGKDRPTDPKRILKILAPMVFEKLKTLDEDSRSAIIKLIGHHATKKNIMVFFKDLIIQKFLEGIGVAGEIAELPTDFSGNYLSVVNANIASGKTDAVIDQKIELRSVIRPSGETEHELTVARRHGGKAEDDWWYRTVNKNYLQVMFAPDAVLKSVSGQDAYAPKPVVDYSAGGYGTDPDLAAFESSALKFGKKSVPLWVLTEPGETSVIRVNYRDGKKIPLTDGAIYEFVFDKQSGVRGGLDLTLTAPEGFTIREENGFGLTKDRMFQFSDEDPAGRVWLRLILEATAPLP